MLAGEYMLDISTVSIREILYALAAGSPKIEYSKEANARHPRQPGYLLPVAYGLEE